MRYLRSPHIDIYIYIYGDIFFLVGFFLLDMLLAVDYVLLLECDWFRIFQILYGQIWGKQEPGRVITAK